MSEGGRARVGTGTLRPFKDERVEYERIHNENTSVSPRTGTYWREGFTDSIYVSGPVSENVTKLTPFKTGGEGPGIKRGNPHVPEFKTRSNGIPKMPRPFSKAHAEYPRDGR